MNIIQPLLNIDEFNRVKPLQISLPTGSLFEQTEIGGLSGITYDVLTDTYYLISDDRGNRSDGVPARFYTADIDLSDGLLDNGNLTFTDVITLLGSDNNPFPANEIDPEGMAFLNSFLYIASEGFTAVENALFQDGSAATLSDESASRIVQYDLKTGEVVNEFLYFVEPIPNDSNPAGGFADNGLVELLAVDNTGTLLALERSFASGVGNNIRLYEVNLQGATDISQFDSIAVDPNNPNDGLYDVDAVAEKRLLLDFDDLGITLDNSEGLTFGETLPNGKASLLLINVHQSPIR